MPDTTVTEVTIEQALAAAAVLEAFGRQGFTKEVDQGKAFGHALTSVLLPGGCIRAAIEALEQWNCHLMVAVLWAIWKGRYNEGHRGNPPHGSVTRKGRNLHIRLPEWWAKD